MSQHAVHTGHIAGHVLHPAREPVAGHPALVALAAEPGLLGLRWSGCIAQPKCGEDLQVVRDVGQALQLVLRELGLGHGRPSAGARGITNNRPQERGGRFQRMTRGDHGLQTPRASGHRAPLWTMPLTGPPPRVHPGRCRGPPVATAPTHLRPIGRAPGPWWRTSASRCPTAGRRARMTRTHDRQKTLPQRRRTSCM